MIYHRLHHWRCGADVIGHQLHTKIVTPLSTPAQNAARPCCQAQYNRRSKMRNKEE